MSTPYPLQPRPDDPQVRAVRRPDPLVGINAAVLVLFCAGLLVAAVLAVYDYNVSPIEGPVALILSGVFAALLALNIVVLTVRARRRTR